MKTLLIVEDELQILSNHRRFFTDNGFRVLEAETAARAREQLAKHTPDIILLDIMLPDGNGLDLLTQWRAAGIILPIIMLTAWGEPQDISRGYRLGATAYFSKPFDYEAVLVFIEGLINSAAQMPEMIEKGALTLNLTSMTAFVNGEDIILTQKEFALLLLFARNEGKTMSAEYIYEKVWGMDTNNDVRTVKNRISKLREKIGESGYTMTAVRGDGYLFIRQ